MCGITGIISKQKDPLYEKQVKRMLDKIKHRGPDGKGFSVHHNVILAMRRLSIIDVKGGDQPLYNEDKSIEIVGNGEIYNYIELGKTLKKLGHKFKTGSDIEMAAHAYEQWGVNSFKKLRGMFALAIYDKKRSKVVLARDRLGEKPIYYSRLKDIFAFSSELKSLLQIKNIDKDIDLDSINDYFHYYYIPEPKTAFKHISKLESGSFLEIDVKTLKTSRKKYWNPQRIAPKLSGDPTNKIRGSFKEACELTLRSDVPVGISLSGGIDSGAILAMTAPKYRGRMKAFSIGYEGSPPSDERRLAKKLAKDFDVDFIEGEIKIKDMIKDFPTTVWHSDDPIADIAAYSIYSVGKLAKKHKIKVLLGGIGGDEIFWGYPSTVNATKKNVRSIILRKLFHKKDYFNYSNPNPIETGSVISSLYTKKFISSVKNSHKKYLVWPKTMNKIGVVKHSMDLVRDLWLKSNVITLSDRMSMASSVELRSPFLDHSLVETSLSHKKIVLGYKRNEKYWFKKAMKDVLPQKILNRTKRGFTPPVDSWLIEINRKYKHLLKNGFLANNEILKKKDLQHIAEGSKSLPKYSLYQIILLEIWGREYVYGVKPKNIK